MDYTIFCRRLYASFGLPSVLFSGKSLLYSTLSDLLGYAPAETYPVEALSINPYVVSARETIIYGLLDVEGSDEHLIIGPVFNVPVNNSILDMFVVDHKIPEQYRRQLLPLLKAIPVTSFRQMQQQMAFFHFCLNGKETDNRNHYEPLDKEIAFQSNEKHFTQMLQKRDEEIQENTYYSELALCRLIQAGDTDGLDRYVRQNAISVQPGQLATSSLRQAKNAFITTVTKIATLGAIPGGMDVEQAYQLMNHFILECEKLDSLINITHMHHTAMFEFCERVHALQMPPRVLSSEIQRCTIYIRNHLDSELTIEKIAQEIGRSISYTSRLFKKEMGMTIAAFIMSCRLEEAKKLLLYSNMKLPEISIRLGFCSQSHFQNNFKKAFGTTPSAYRRDERKFRYFDY